MTTTILPLPLEDLKTELLIMHKAIDNIYSSKTPLVKPKLTINKIEIPIENYYKKRHQLIKEALIESMKIYKKDLKESLNTQNKLTA